MPTQPNRIDQLAAPSPTGTPIIPPKVVPWLGVAFAALVALQASLTLPPVVNAVLSGAIGLLGLLSPGLRR